MKKFLRASEVKVFAKNENILSSVTGKSKDIFVWIENDILLQGACNLGSEPPPTIITTQKVTLCEYLKGAGFDSIFV